MEGTCTSGATMGKVRSDTSEVLRVCTCWDIIFHLGDKQVGKKKVGP